MFRGLLEWFTTGKVTSDKSYQVYLFTARESRVISARESVSAEAETPAPSYLARNKTDSSFF